MQDTVHSAIPAMPMSRSPERLSEGEGEGQVVSLDLGRRRLCLSEVLGLQPDMQIDVPFEHKMTLRLRVNGRLAGRGECVALGSHWGVRVIEVYRSQADSAATPSA